MGRHAKGIADTRAAILRSAWSLFGDSGYESTTIEAIIEKTGVSKGAFYHHFRSKEDLLDALAGMTTELSMIALKPLLDDDQLPAMGKLDRLLEGIRGWRIRNLQAVTAIGKALYRPENLALKEKVVRAARASLLPHLAEVIGKGTAEATFSVRDPLSTARMILDLTSTTSEHLMEELGSRYFGAEAIALVMNQLDFVLEGFERLLAAPKGCFTRPATQDIEAFCRLCCREGET